MPQPNPNLPPKSELPAAPDRYAVVGQPIAHSRSPFIHAEFARQTGQRLTYDAIAAPLDGFADTVRAFRAEGGRGLNVTVPFKLQAFELADECSERARLAGAANTLLFRADGRVYADNTDGVGLVTELRRLLGDARPLAGQRIALLGAGGAARGVLLPLLETRPAALVLANRTPARAEELARVFSPAAAQYGVALSACEFAHLAEGRFDLLINATASGLAAESLPLPWQAALLTPCATAYDMVYAAQDTPFMRDARTHGAETVADGLGMLVEQAAESFALWRGVRPQTGEVLRRLRAALHSA